MSHSRRGWEEALGRVGLTAKGVSYGLVGVLAIGVAVGVGGAATSRQGALHDLAGTGFGMFLLVLLVIGFAAYAAWRVLQAFTVREHDTKKAWGKRVGYLGRAAVYGSLAFSAGKIVAGSGGGQSQNQKAHKTTAVVLLVARRHVARRNRRSRADRRRAVEPLSRAHAQVRGQVDGWNELVREEVGRSCGRRRSHRALASSSR